MVEICPSRFQIFDLRYKYSRISSSSLNVKSSPKYFVESVLLITSRLESGSWSSFFCTTKLNYIVGSTPCRQGHSSFQNFNSLNYFKVWLQIYHWRLDAFIRMDLLPLNFQGFYPIILEFVVWVNKGLILSLQHFKSLGLRKSTAALKLISYNQ